MLFESSERVRVWDINDFRAQRVHRLIGEMIAIDTQPFSIVENEGFTNLLKALEPRYSLPSRRHMTETVLPRIMAGVTACVKLEIANVKWFSFTTDIWSTRAKSGTLLLNMPSHIYHWDIVEKIVAVLNPGEEIIQSISTEVASVSLIIPFIRAFRRTLEDHNNDRGIRTMKSEMLDSLNRKYGDAENNESLVLATLLDPRFKDKFFSGVHEKIKAKELFDEKVAEITSTDQPRVPSPKRQKTDLLKCFAEILEEAGVEVDTCNAVVDKYLAKPLIPFHRGNSLSWWAENKIRFPALAKLSQKYLSAPPTSVPSERLFSGAGEIYDPKKNRLAPERAEMLFIKKGFTMFSSIHVSYVIVIMSSVSMHAQST